MNGALVTTKSAIFQGQVIEPSFTYEVANGDLLSETWNIYNWEGGRFV